MSKYTNLSELFAATADAIRSKDGSSGLISPGDFPEKIINIPTGGDNIGSEQVYYVNYRHYDGTILYRYTKEEFLALKESPAGPNFEGLIFKGWNWQLAEAQDYIKDFPVDFEIGASYDTEDNTINVFLEVEQECELCIYDSRNAIKNIDWGDGVIVNAAPVNKIHAHTLNRGIYKLRLYSSQYGFDTTSYEKSGYNLFFGDAAKYIIGIEFPSNVEITVRGDDNHWLSNLTNLRKILLNGTLTDLANTRQIRLPYISFSQNSKITTDILADVISIGSGAKVHIPNYSVMRSLVVPENTNIVTGQNAISIDKLYGKNLQISTVNITYKETNAIVTQSVFTTNDTIVYKGVVSSAVQIPQTVKTIIYDKGSTYCTLYNGYNVENVVIPPTSNKIFGIQSLKPINVYIEDLNSYVGTDHSSTMSEDYVRLYLNNELLTSKNMTVGDITKIGNYALCRVDGIDSFTIPTSVTSIGYEAFAWTGLKSIIIPSNVKTINSIPFSNCRELTSIIFEEGVETINSLCSYCPVTEIHFPDSLLKITSFPCIQYCPNLRTVKMGKNIQSLSSLLLMGIPEHVNLDFSDVINIPTVSSGDFTRYVASYSIIVPDSLYDQWIVATNWSRLASKIIKKSDWDAQNA